MTARARAAYRAFTPLALISSILALCIAHCRRWQDASTPTSSVKASF